MREFIRGWRRKVGVVTLVLACVFMGGWVRSRSIIDSFSAPIAANTIYAIGSIDCHIALHMCHDIPVGKMTKVPEWNSHRFDIPNSNDFEKFEDIFDDPSITAMWRYYDFALICFLKNENVVVVIIPYWLIITPLTLISLYLLLFKPRQSTPKKTDEPVANEGA